MTRQTRKPVEHSFPDSEVRQLPPVHITVQSPERVEASSMLPLDTDDTIPIAALVAHLGTVANQLGVRYLDSPQRVAIERGLTIEQFRSLEGDVVCAIATPCVADVEHPIWRAQIFRYAAGANPDASFLIAEVTQRFQLVTPQDSMQTRLESDATPAPPVKAIQVSKNEDSVIAKRQEAVDRRRMQIFQGACEVISRKGWANASIRDIVQAAKIPIPTLYQYIKNKEDILYLVTSMCMEEILLYFQERINEDKEPLESLVDAIEAYFQYIDKNRRYINLVYSETRSLSDENREKIFYLEKKFISLWEAVLIKGNNAGVFDVENTDLAANLIYFLCTAWALRHWSIKRYPEQEVRSEILKIILHGISMRA